MAATGRLPRDSDLLIDQMRAIDSTRLIRGPLAQLSRAAMNHVLSAVVELLDGN